MFVLAFLFGLQVMYGMQRAVTNTVVARFTFTNFFIGHMFATSKGVVGLGVGIIIISFETIELVGHRLLGLASSLLSILIDLGQDGFEAFFGYHVCFFSSAFGFEFVAFIVILYGLI